MNIKIGNFFRLLRSKMPVKEFVVITTGRTGSNMLLSLMESHKDIKVNYEIFNVSGAPEERLTMMLRDPYVFMKDYFSIKNNEDKQIAGFKLFYNHAKIQNVKNFINNKFSNSPEEYRKRQMKIAAFIKDNFQLNQTEEKFKRVWEYIINNNKLCIIHLKRANLLEKFYSKNRATITGRWSSKSKQLITVPQSINLSKTACEKFFKDSYEQEKKMDALLANSRKIDVYYEDLRFHRKETMEKIFRFLSLNPVDKITSSFKKQNKLPLNESIENYYQLKNHFTGTRWEKYFNVIE